jgi:hypothetical protein
MARNHQPNLSPEVKEKRWRGDSLGRATEGNRRTVLQGRISSSHPSDQIKLQSRLISCLFKIAQS